MSLSINNEFSLIPSDIVRQRVVDSRENKIQSINKELIVKEKLLDNSNRLIDRYKEYLSSSERLIASNNKLIALNKEQRQLLIESKELITKRIENNNKIISLLDNTNEKLQALLDGKTPTRSKSAEPLRAPKLEVSELKPSLAKGEILQAQSAKIEDTIKKQDIAIDFKNKEIAKLESNVEKLKNQTLASASASVSSSKKAGLATNYTPPVSYTSRFNESSISTRNELSDFSKFTLEQQRYIAQSQANLFDSFATANIKKLI